MLTLIGALDRVDFRKLLDRFAEEDSLGSREAFTPKGIAALLSRIAGAEGAPQRVLDPYARGGELLTAALDAYADRPHPEVCAVSPHTGMLRLAAMNVMVHGAIPELRSDAVAPWLSTDRDRLRADRVLANPPFNASAGGSAHVEWRYGDPPPSNDNFAWLQHVLSMLRPGGRAAVVMADNAAASDQPKEREIRRAMVEDGVVECVIALPSKLFTGTKVSACIWVLGTPTPHREHVQFINARKAGEMVTRTRRELGQEDAELLLQAYRSLRDGGTWSRQEHGDHVMGRSVPLAEVRFRHYSLSPVDYVDAAPQVTTTLGDVVDARAELLRVQDIAADRDRLAESHWRAGGPAGDTGQWSSRGWERRELGSLCTVQAGPSPSLLHTGLFDSWGVVPVVLPKHLRDRRVCDVVDSRTSDDVARKLNRFRLHEGDILCARTGTVGPSALVDASHEGALFHGNLLRLYEFAADVDPRYILAFLSLPQVVGWIKDRAAMTTVASIKGSTLRQLLVPVPPLQEQRRVGALLHSLDQQVAAHLRVAEEADRAHRNLTGLWLGDEVSPGEPATTRIATTGLSDEGMLK